MSITGAGLSPASECRRNPVAMSKWYKTNQAVGVYLAILTGLLLAYLWSMPWVHRVMRDGFLLGFFPLLGAGAMFLFSAAMIFDPLRRETPEALERFRIGDVLLPLAMLLGIAAYFAVMVRIGFVLATPLFVFAYMAWLRVRPWRLLVVLSLVIPITIYVLFSLLGVRLPHGILPPLI
jgi:hypothetical protein